VPLIVITFYCCSCCPWIAVYKPRIAVVDQLPTALSDFDKICHGTVQEPHHLEKHHRSGFKMFAYRLQPPNRQNWYFLV